MSVIHLTAATGISLDGDGQQQLVQAGILPVLLLGHCSLTGREKIGLGIIGNVVDVNFRGRVEGSNLASVPDLCGNLEVSFIGCNA